jgi:hypothetical protein
MKAIASEVDETNATDNTRDNAFLKLSTSSFFLWITRSVDLRYFIPKAKEYVNATKAVIPKYDFPRKLKDFWGKRGI